MALKKCHEAELKTYLFVSPIFPYLTDIKEIINTAAPYVDYFMFENLNVRPNNRKRVMDFISENAPELLASYKDIYDSKNRAYWAELECTINTLCKSNYKEARIYFHHGGFKKK